MKILRKKNYEQNIKQLIKSNLLNLDFIYNFDSSKKVNNNILDPLVFIKSIKQLIRVLQFLKQQKNPYLYLDTHDNDFIETVISLMSLKKKKKVTLFFLNQFPLKYKVTNKNYKVRKTSILYLYLNSESFKPNYFRSLFLKSIFMIYSVNGNINSNNLGYYKFFLDLNEIKKIFFMSILLKKYLHL